MTTREHTHAALVAAAPRSAVSDTVETHPAAECFPMHNQGRFAELTEDIRRHGLLDPIVLHGGKVLDGRNRLKACELAGVEPRFVEHDGDPVSYVRSMNAMRRDLSPDQRRACLVDLEDLEADYRGRNQYSEPETVSGSNHSVAATNVAEHMGESARTSHKAVIVKKQAPDLHEAVKAGKLTHNQASQLAKAPKEDRAAVLDKIEAGTKPNQAVRELKREQLAEQSMELPDGIFRVIYADPPWSYGDAKAIDSYTRLAAAQHYPTMSLADICALPVRDIAAEDAVLFLWVTAPHALNARDVIEAWGFKYKTQFVWDKERANLGNYHGAQHELLYIATRGSCVPEISERPDSVQVVRRTGRHSTKPNHFREMIDRMYPSGPRVELFRRGDAPEGWTVWGNESEAAE